MRIMVISYFFIWISLIQKSWSMTKIYISPSNSVLQGVRVNISCSSNSPSGLIKWRFNGKEVAEDSSSYKKELFEIHQNNNRFDLIIKEATLGHRGNWSCKHIADDAQEVSLSVSVPWTLKAITAKKIVDGNRKTSLKANNSYDSIETGHKKFAYNLMSNDSLEITCVSECGLPPPKSISVFFSNLTKTGELSRGSQKLLTCNPNKELQMLVHTIRINCKSNGLVNRNEIICQSQGVDGNTLSNKPIFILCPNYTNVNELTKGELIAIAVSLILAIIDVVVIVLLLKKNCQASKLSQSKSEIIRCPEVML